MRRGPARASHAALAPVGAAPREGIHALPEVGYRLHDRCDSVASPLIGAVQIVVDGADLLFGQARHLRCVVLVGHCAKATQRSGSKSHSGSALTSSPQVIICRQLDAVSSGFAPRMFPAIPVTENAG